MVEDKSLPLCEQEIKWLCMAYICPVKAEYFTSFATENENEPPHRMVSSLNAEFLLIKLEPNSWHAETYLELQLSATALQWK